jgi:hypothetical protein
MPPGPVALYGDIIFHSNFVENELREDPKAEEKFKFVMAHELVHVFNFLRLLVPAFQNWKRFWKICLDEGDACEEIANLCMFKNVFVDSYGTENELAMVSEFWPQSAKKWFEAFC